MNKGISGLVFPHLDKALLDFFFGEVGFHLGAPIPQRSLFSLYTSTTIAINTEVHKSMEQTHNPIDFPTIGYNKNMQKNASIVIIESVMP